MYISLSLILQCEVISATYLHSQALSPPPPTHPRLTHPTVTRHLLKKTHPEVEILRWSLFKPLGCLLLKCLSRNAECPQQQWTHQLPCRSAQLPPPSRLKLTSLSLASGACLASHSTLASLHAKTAGKVQESLALAFNLVVAMPRPGGLFAILL